VNSIALLCTDGSDNAIEALRASLPVLAPSDRKILVTVESWVDPELETGTGFVIEPSSSEPSDQIKTSGDRAAKAHLDRTVEALGLDDVELRAVVGRPGQAICELAEALPASVVVMGTSGQGAVRRAIVGSTSDYVIRHADCPVLVQAVGRR
jgi:nucleotide-binding universal stress UspA family protein